MTWPKQPPLYVRMRPPRPKFHYPWLQVAISGALAVGWWAICHWLHWPRLALFPGYFAVYLSCSIIGPKLRRRRNGH